MFDQKSCKMDFSKFIVLVWHGQDCKKKTKWLGAWLLWFFTIIAHLFNVFNFIFAKSSWRKICFCHTITCGTDLRRSPHLVILIKHFVKDQGVLLSWLVQKYVMLDRVDGPQLWKCFGRPWFTKNVVKAKSSWCSEKYFV